MAYLGVQTTSLRSWKSFFIAHLLCKSFRSNRKVKKLRWPVDYSQRIVILLVSLVGFYFNLLIVFLLKWKYSCTVGDILWQFALILGFWSGLTKAHNVGPNQVHDLVNFQFPSTGPYGSICTVAQWIKNSVVIILPLFGEAHWQNYCYCHRGQGFLFIAHNYHSYSCVTSV